ncbi:hypothetical protein [Hahella sp. CCB-MM4]|uniref:hypothetical protein n=1 Tax=Hahella sp. (strain CCB-MM4) TaxID=1926491 RepID=UPI00113FFBFF|nr:hypothetical protein [Hahella sp. CCB-MM4]
MSNTINLDHFTLPGAQSEVKAAAIPEKKHWKVQDRIIQVTRDGRTHTYSRFNQRYLEVKTTDRKGREVEAVIDMSFLQSRPRIVKDFKWTLWLLSSLLLAWTITVFAVTDIDPLWLIPTLLLSCLVAALAVRLKVNKYEFLAVGSEIPLFSLEANQPNKDTVKSLVIKLQENIEEARLSLPGGKQLIPIAVTEMRRLYKEGLISQQDYETIKWYLFRN